MNSQDDIFYITKVLKGETNAYSFLVNRHKRMAYTLALKIVSVPEDAEEVAQDAFVKAYQSLGDFKGESKFSTWLFKIVYHLSVSKLRKKQLNTFSINDDRFHTFDIGDSDNILSKITREEQDAMLRSAIDRLAAEEKALVTLYYTNESSVKEIAGITDDSESNVKIKLFRIRKKLGEMLSPVFTNKTNADHEK
ncbi:MAG: RNA polymerase sigma factor [Bacteroidota bacterium]|nr:RNA polymerase sigma factor [Bacteroidota bacterium]